MESKLPWPTSKPQKLHPRRLIGSVFSLKMQHILHISELACSIKLPSKIHKVDSRPPSPDTHFVLPPLAEARLPLPARRGGPGVPPSFGPRGKSGAGEIHGHARD